MPIVRTSTLAGRWFPFPREAANSPQLSFEARGMLAYLLEKGDNWRVQVEDLMEKSGAGRDKTRRVLSELEAAGYVVRRRVRDDAGRFEWETTVYDLPKAHRSAVKQPGRKPRPVSIRQATSPAPEKPATDKPPTVFQALESDSKKVIVDDANASSTPALENPTSGGWPRGVSKSAAEALVAAGYTPESAVAESPVKLLAVPNVGRSTVKALTGVDPKTVVESEVAVRQKAIMEAYCEALAYTPAQMKISFNGGREGAACKILAAAGYQPEQVVACYLYYKSSDFWKDKHLGLHYVANNIAAWVQSGSPRQAQGKGNARQPQINNRPYDNRLGALSVAEREELTAKLRAARG